MSEAGEIAPASGPTIHRDAAIAALLPGRTTREVAELVGCGPSTVGRVAKKLEIPLPPPGKPAKYPPVISLGPCGAGGCADPECDVPPGTCHCDDCRRHTYRKTTSKATRHDRRLGYVKGKHQRFALGHYVPSDAYRRVQSDNMAAKRDDGTISTARVALARHGSTRVFGREAKAIAAKRGKKVGPEFSRVDVFKAEKILRLADERKPDGRPRHSQRTIARLAGVSRGSVENVLRRREGVVSHFLLDELA